MIFSKNTWGLKNNNSGLKIHRIFLKNHIYFLNKNNKDVKWGLQIFHCEGNENFIRNIVDGWENVVLTKLDIENIDKKSHTELFKSLDFWESVEGETILNFQIDSVKVTFFHSPLNSTL